MYAYLTITAGQRAGSNIVLDQTKEIRLGRGQECTVVLPDALCSRVHASIVYTSGRWRIRDAGSRNGTYVNGSRVDEAVLDDGHTIRLGGTEFVFHTSDLPPTVGGSAGLHAAQTLISSVPLVPLDLDPAAQALVHHGEHANHLVLLDELWARLLCCPNTPELMRATLDFLQERTRASMAAFLLVDAQGRLKPRWVVPQASTRAMEPDETLARLVVNEGHAVWVAAQESSETSLQHVADALCIPLVWNRAVLGALYLVLDHGRFRQSQFELAILAARMVAAMLAQLRQQEVLAAEVAWLRSVYPESEQWLGRSAAIQSVWSDALRAAAHACALIQGEPGTGKEFLARLMYRHGSENAGPLVVVHCSAAEPQDVESRLFGHAAEDCPIEVCDHRGLVERAGDGTIILKEVGLLARSAQARLLRLLEGLPFIRPADGAELLLHPRVFATSRQELCSYVQAGTFRDDLYQRLSAFTLTVPPLRERPEDIEPLVDFFLDAYAKLHGRPALGIAADARDRLLNYHWPGNVRQLRCAIEYAVTTAAGPQIAAADLPLPGAAFQGPGSLRMEDWERRLISEALARTAGNIPQAAQLLGVGRATLYRKCEQYGIQRGEK